MTSRKNRTKLHISIGGGTQHVPHMSLEAFTQQMSDLSPHATIEVAKEATDELAYDSHHSANRSNTRRMLTTEELASQLSLRAQTLRKHFCLTGSFYGVRPIKLSPGRGGRLLWPADALEQIAARGQ